MMGHYDDSLERDHDERLERNRKSFHNKKPIKGDIKWHIRFMDLAKEISLWSKDPSTKIGAIAVRNRRVIAQGYNGFPANIRDDIDRLKEREVKYKYMIHAEMNMIFNAAKEGVSLQDADVYVWGLPTCSECAKGLIQSGVSTVFISEECLSERWAKSWEFSKDLYWESGMNYELLGLQCREDVIE